MNASIYKTGSLKDNYKLDKVLGEYKHFEGDRITDFLEEVLLLSEKVLKSPQTKNSPSRLSTSKL